MAANRYYSTYGSLVAVWVMIVRKSSHIPSLKISIEPIAARQMLISLIVYLSSEERSYMSASFIYCLVIWSRSSHFWPLELRTAFLKTVVASYLAAGLLVCVMTIKSEIMVLAWIKGSDWKFTYCVFIHGILDFCYSCSSDIIFYIKGISVSWTYKQRLR